MISDKTVTIRTAIYYLEAEENLSLYSSVDSLTLLSTSSRFTFSFIARNGARPSIISYTRQPRLNQSGLKVYFSLSMISGAMQPTVPTRPLTASPSGISTARPRSDILKGLLIRRVAYLKSKEKSLTSTICHVLQMVFYDQQFSNFVSSYVSKSSSNLQGNIVHLPT